MGRFLYRGWMGGCSLGPNWIVPFRVGGHCQVTPNNVLWKNVANVFHREGAKLNQLQTDNWDMESISDKTAPDKMNLSICLCLRNY